MHIYTYITYTCNLQYMGKTCLNRTLMSQILIENKIKMALEIVINWFHEYKCRV